MNAGEVFDAVIAAGETEKAAEEAAQQAALAEHEQIIHSMLVNRGRD